MSLTGTTLKGTYQVGRRMAAGGMGVVYEATHVRLPRRYAIKVLTPEMSTNAQAVGRFQREAEIVAGFGHPHIVDVLDFDELETGQLYMVMEFLEGEDLAARLQRGALDVGTTLRVFRDVCSALQVAHDAGIVHRDLKPANLFLIQRDGRSDFAKVLDFGISKIIQSTTNLTQDKAVMGTPSYMSPEQAQGETSLIDQRTDIFALGAILFECLSGQLAFGGDSALAILFKITQPARPSLVALRPDIPRAIEQVVLRALAPVREDRFASPRELYAALLDAASNAPGTVPPGPIAADPLAATAAQAPLADTGGIPAATALPSQLQSPSQFPAPRVGTNPLAETQVPAATGADAPAPRKSGVPGWIIGAGALAVAGGIAAAVVLGGGDDSTPTARTEPPIASLDATPAPGATAGAVSFEVRSDPTDAVVAIDGKTYGPTPVVAAVPPGAHELVVTRDGYAPATTTLDVADGMGYVVVSLCRDECKGDGRVPDATARRDPPTSVPPKAEPKKQPPKPDPPKVEPRKDPRKPEPPKSDPPKPRISYEDAMASARAQLKSRKYGAALSSAEAALAAKPGDPEAGMVGTVAACGAGKEAKAKALLPKSRGSFRDIAVRRCGRLGMNID